jgi:predicted O-methyltransferase YrrM
MPLWEKTQFSHARSQAGEARAILWAAGRERGTLDATRSHQTGRRRVKLKELFGIKDKNEHRIIVEWEKTGDQLQPEYHRPTPECPEPQRWSMFDSMTAEYEVLEFLRCVVTTLKPRLVVETGTFMGVSTLWIADALKRNGRGKVVTCEFDPKVFGTAKQRIDSSRLGEWIEYRCESSLEMKVDGPIDLLFSDSDMPVREQEVRRFLPQMSPSGIILMHDASSHLKVVREAALKLEREGLISVVLLPTPRGLVMAQKREGRK